MAKYETISAKIPLGLKDEAKQLGVDTNQLIRIAIENEIKKKKAQQLDKELASIDAALRRVRIEDVVADIREDREQR